MPLLSSALPTYYTLQNLLQGVFHWQAREVARMMDLDAIRAGDFPDLDHLAVRAAQTVKPLIMQSFQHGMVRSQRRIQHMVRFGRPMADDMRQHVLTSQQVFGAINEKSDKNKSKTQRLRQVPYEDSSGTYAAVHENDVQKGKHSLRKIGWDGAALVTKKPLMGIFDLFNSKVLTAVDRLTLRFCRETNATAMDRLHVSLEALRKALKRGLQRGDAVAYLARKVNEIFADPSRAFRIAATESSRAMHAGAYMTAEENDAVRGIQWLASSDACDRCLKLDGKVRRFGKAFYIDPKGGPYAKVMHPPLHPHCFCDVTEVLA